MYTAYIDLDDTLLDDKKRISQFTCDSLSEFQRRGNNIVFATARSARLHGLQDCLKKATPYYILHNGGEIYSHGKLIKRYYFSREQTMLIGAYLSHNGIKAAVITEREYYANYDAPAIWGNIENFILTDFSDTGLCAPKFTLMLENDEQIEKAAVLNAHARIEITDRNSTAIISPLSASKGMAVRYMQEKMFPGSKSIYIGNDNNDLSGFKACDTKVAVANASQKLLAAADIVIGDNNHDGVARFLYKF